jgi:hypothetical protein
LGVVPEVKRKDYTIKFRLKMTSSGNKTSYFTILNPSNTQQELVLNVLEHWAG